MHCVEGLSYGDLLRSGKLSQFHVLFFMSICVWYCFLFSLFHLKSVERGPGDGGARLVHLYRVSDIN